MPIPDPPRPAEAPDVPWHALSASQAVERLGSDARRGLGVAHVARRQAEHGPNALPDPPPRSPWRRLARQFASPLIYLLFFAALLALWLGHVSDTVVIVVVVVVNAGIGFYQEGRAERSMAALRRLAVLQVRVVRDGAEQAIAAHGLVPGDVMLLAAGDAVAADARLLEHSQLQVAEAALTGESLPQAKDVAAVPPATTLADRRSMVHAGTHVTAGRARALVVAIGAHTEVGRIAGLTERAAEPKTPLELRLQHFGHALALAALALCVLLVVLGLARGMPAGELLMVSISQMVSMVPEGLPVAMTIALAVGMQRMAARGAVIRRLAAVETLGSTTVICSDKTGTLTRNEMTAVELWLPGIPGARAGTTLLATGRGYGAGGRISGQDPESGAADDPALQALLRAAVLCNDARWQPLDDGQGSVDGDPTEGALLVLAAKAGLDAETLRRRHPRLGELPFDAGRQLMATLHAADTAAVRRLVCIKGAPEAVLRLCAGPALDPSTSASAAAAADSMAARALRVLAIAEVDADALGDAVDIEALAGRARLLGLIGQIDPPREGAAAAVAACRQAGIRTLMVTGDHPATGLAIARELGIARPGDVALAGPELERIDDRELQRRLPQVAVFARVQPVQKLRIVEALQARGDVVAMTGDGVNDAPALARADVGVAMGRGGTEVAKSAARIVVMDDDFATIVRAVEQGRVVYGNLKKVILYLFATSIDEVLVLVLALLAGCPLPLLAVQILWINIVTEGTMTLNLVMEPAEGREMQRPPVARDDRLLDRAMLLRVALMAGVAAAVAFGWFAWRLEQGIALDQARTELFTLTAITQWFNVLNCRSATGSVLGTSLLRNPWLLVGLGLSVLLQAAVLYWAPLAGLFHAVPLDAPTLLALVLLGSSVVWVEEVRKAVVRRRNGRAAVAA